MIDLIPNPFTQTIAAKFAILRPLLDERARRLWAAVEARAIGRGGISQVAEATGLSRPTIRAGLQELASPVLATGPQATTERVRCPGGGRKPLGARDPHLVQALETLVEPVTRGDPMSLLRWTCKSAAKLAAALQAQGHRVSERTVNRLLHDLGYSLQSNRKTLEGRHHPDRDAQFQYINRRAKAFQRQGQPVVSVDTKKKELVGQFRMVAVSGTLTGSPKRGRATISLMQCWARSFPMASTTRRPTPAGSAWGSIMIRPSLPWRPSGGGGGTWGVRSIHGRSGC